MRGFLGNLRKLVIVEIMIMVMSGDRMSAGGWVRNSGSGWDFCSCPVGSFQPPAVLVAAHHRSSLRGLGLPSLLAGCY